MASNSHTRRGEKGYILLALLLIVALMIIATAIILPSITFEIRRNREEELVHRGVQYSRAIRAYYKKFGRYPTKIEDLESSNNLRFLRKRYKDPMTGKDFKLLHYGEVKMTLGGIGGGTIPGASPIGSPTAPNASGGPGGLGQTSSFGGNTFGGNGASGANSNSPIQPNAANPTTGTDASNSSGPGTGSTSTGTNPSGTSSTGTTSSSTPGPGNSASDANNPSGQTFGGGPIVGVVSSAKCPPRPVDECEGYREFNHKKKYNEWQFFYDPGVDRGGLIMTPNQPPLLGMGEGIPGATTPGAPVNGTGSGFSPIGGNQNQPGNTGINPPTTTAPPTPPGNSPQ